MSERFIGRGWAFPLRVGPTGGIGPEPKLLPLADSGVCGVWLPERAPDLICDLGTRPEMALVYRLSADLNPLHADLDVAKAAGFPRPILHGLGTFGVVGHALLKSVCNYDPARFTAMSGRFSAPVFPGETIRTEVWRDDAIISFRAKVVEATSKGQEMARRADTILGTPPAGLDALSPDELDTLRRIIKRVGSPDG